MKFSVTFKTPAAVDYAIEAAVEQAVSADNLTNDQDAEEAMDTARQALEPVIAKFIEHGEYVTIDFDSDAGTATVRPVGRV